jgi:hypothetical protein
LSCCEPYPIENKQVTLVIKNVTGVVKLVSTVAFVNTLISKNCFILKLIMHRSMYNSHIILMQEKHVE